MRATGFRAGARQSLATERLYADHSTDLVAVDVDIAHMGMLRQRLRAAVDAGLDADGQAIAQRVDLESLRNNQICYGLDSCLHCIYGL